LPTSSVDLGFDVDPIGLPVGPHDVSERVRVFDGPRIDIAAHSDQPAPEVVEAIVRGAAVDEIRSRPKISSIRTIREAGEDAVPLENLVGWEPF